MRSFTPALLTLISGCHLMLGGGAGVASDGAAPDGAAPRDAVVADRMSPRDGPTDQRRDRGLDGTVLDAPSSDFVLPSGDMSSGDLPLDQNIAITDGLAPDVQPPQDIGPDAPPPAGPCATGSPTHYYSSGTMAVCASVGPVNQCQAAAVCGAWPLCTTSQFLARGGVAEYPGPNPPNTHPAWIAGCIRVTEPLFLPSNAVCTNNCTVVPSVSTIPVGWTCPNGSVWWSTDEAPLGLHAAGNCTSPSADHMTWGAQWEMAHVSTSFNHVLCCQP